MKKTIFCVIALGMSVATVYGQDEVTAINTGAANFLTIMPDARTAALAGAGVSLTGNENAIFLNGATIAADKNCRGGASYTYAPWMRDYQSGYSLHTLGGFYKIDEKNVIQVTFFNRLIINHLYKRMAYNMPTFLIYYRLFLT